MENESKRESNEVPFAGDLINSDISEAHKESDKLNEIENNPNKIIRTEMFDGLNERYRNKIEIIELVQIAKKLYEELETKYDISVPVDFLIGKDKGGYEVVYSIVDRIEGENLDKVESSDEIVAQVQTLYASVARYFFNKSKEEGFYLADINNPSQYVYGRKQGEQVEKIYFVDTDIYIHNSKVGIYTVVEWLARHIVGTERHFRIKLEKAREYVEQFISQPLPENMKDSEKEEVDGNIIEIKKFLNESKLDYNPGPAIPDFN